MPTTLTGLLLFVILLLPGFAFLAVFRRTRPERRLSTLRETGTVVFTSVVADLLALALFALLRAGMPSHTPHIGQLIADPRTYIVDHHLPLFLWAIGLLAAAGGFAALLGWIGGRISAHPSTMSSWWTLFGNCRPGARVNVSCVLDDGSWVSGLLANWNTLEDETLDRDLVLTHGQGIPLLYQPPGDTHPVDYKASAVCISASRIVTMFVSHLPSQTPIPLADSPGVAAPSKGKSSADPLQGSDSQPVDHAHPAEVQPSSRQQAVPASLPGRDAYHQTRRSPIQVDRAPGPSPAIAGALTSPRIVGRP